MARKRLITLRAKGSTVKTRQFLTRDAELDFEAMLRRYGRKGIEALKANTPVHTGKTRDSWDYRIVHSKGFVSIEFFNTNMMKDTSVVKLLIYGHATKTGTWVAGNDFVSPAIKPIFKKLSNEIWKEVNKT